MMGGRVRKFLIRAPYWAVRLVFENIVLFVGRYTILRSPQPASSPRPSKHGLSYSRKVSSRLLLKLNKVLCYSGKDLRAAWPADGIPETTHRKYNAFAKWAAEHWAMYYSFIAKYSPKGYILDFGCGIGNMTANLAAALPNSNILGLDLNKRGIEIGKTRFRSVNLDLVHGDALSAHFEEQFDYVFCIEVLEHVNPQDHDRLMQAAFNVLRPGGLFFMTTPNAQEEEDHDWGHIGLLNNHRAKDFFFRYRDRIHDFGFLDNSRLDSAKVDDYVSLRSISATGEFRTATMSHFWVVFKK
jgi:SAM-dependent methyltransferase